MSCWAYGASVVNASQLTTSVKQFDDVATRRSDVVETSEKKRDHVYNDHIDPAEASLEPDQHLHLQHKALHSKAASETPPASARRRRRTVTTKADHHRAIMAESDSGLQEQPSLTRGVAGHHVDPVPFEGAVASEHQVEPGPFKRMIAWLSSVLSTRSINTAKPLFGTNLTTLSLLSSPMTMSHSMLDSYSSNSAGLMLCLVFVIAIAFIGGAAICMAMIDSDQAPTPR